MTQMIYTLRDNADEDGTYRIGSTDDLRAMMQDHFKKLRRRGDVRTRGELILVHKLVVIAHATTRADAARIVGELAAQAQQRGELACT